MGKILGLITGSNPYLLAAIFALGFGLGGTAGYKWEHGQVLQMELSIANQKIEAAQILAVETSKVAVAEENQRKLNVDKDKAYAKLKENSAASDSKLRATIDGMLFTKRGESSSSPAGEGDNSAIDIGDDTEFTWVSRRFLERRAEESGRAQKDGLDKNRLLDFIKQDNCGIPK